MAAQQGTVYRYFRADADKDISGDVFDLSADEIAWTAGTYIAPDDLPPSIAAVDTATPASPGRTGYWWRVLTGPGSPLPLQRGTNNIRGRCTDNPETPHFGWTVYVGIDE